jgi:hypothetical protein
MRETRPLQIDAIRRADPVRWHLLELVSDLGLPDCWIAAGFVGTGQLAIASPFGLDDLFNLVLRPTRRFAAEKRHIFEERIRSRAWLTAWPMLRLAEPLDR